MKLMRSLWIIIAVLLLAPVSVRAYTPQVIISSSCSAQANPTGAWGCYDAVLNELFVWNGSSAFTAVGGGGGDTITSPVGSCTIGGSSTNTTIDCNTTATLRALSGITYTITVGTNTTQLPATATTTYFNGFLGAVSATETNTRGFISQPTAICSNLNCMVLTTPGAGNTHTFTLRTPTGTSPASGPTCAISGTPAVACSDTTHTAACGGASFSIQDTTTGTPTASVGGCSFQVSY